jgi:hypothetical protein
MNCNRSVIILLMLAALLINNACTRKEIEFGTVPENNYSHLVYIDSVGIQQSTVITDSFETGGATSLLLGRYKDPFLGVISARSFFQMDKPSTFQNIETGTIYDSLVLVIKPNEYYYGDTNRVQTIYVHELAKPIVLSYASKLYNTGSTEIKPAQLGSRTLRIRPVIDDSIMIRLDDNKGRELFDMLQHQSPEVTNSNNFLNYFYGISLSTGETDTTSIIGLQTGSSLWMRLYYHTNTPYNVNTAVDFPMLANTYTYNQILANRTGTGIISVSPGISELPASRTGGYSFTQLGTGMAAKISFPGLRGILLNNQYLKLLKAELILRPAENTFDKEKFKLPDRLELLSTDATNINQGSITDSTGTGILYATPVIDEFYGRNYYFRFNLTTYINTLLNTPGSEDFALYIQPTFNIVTPNVNRLIIGGSSHDGYVSQLRLSVLIINN